MFTMFFDIFECRRRGNESLTLPERVVTIRPPGAPAFAGRPRVEPPQAWSGLFRSITGPPGGGTDGVHASACQVRACATEQPHQAIPSPAKPCQALPSPAKQFGGKKIFFIFSTTGRRVLPAACPHPMQGYASLHQLPPPATPSPVNAGEGGYERLYR